MHGHDIVGVTTAGLGEQLALCLHEDIAVFLQFEPVHTTRTAAMLDHCNDKGTGGGMNTGY